MADQDGTFRLGYELSELESGGKRALLLSEEHASRMAQAHAKHAKEADEKWSKVGERLGLGELKAGLMGAIGGGTLYGAVEVLHEILESYVKINTEAIIFRTTAEDIQRTTKAAKGGATDFDTLGESVQHLRKSLENIADPEVQKALDGLNLKSVAIAGEDVNTQWAMVARAFNRAQLEGRGLNEIQTLMGKSVVNNLALFRQVDEVLARQKNYHPDSGNQVKEMAETSEQAGRIWAGMKDMPRNLIHNSLKAVNESVRKGGGFMDAVKALWEAPPGYQEAIDKQKRAFEESENKKHGLVRPGSDIDWGAYGKETSGNWLAPWSDAFMEAGSQARKMADKRSQVDREAQAESDRASKVILANQREVLALQEQLNDARSAAGMSDLSPLEKQVYLENQLTDKEREITMLKSSGVFKQQDLIKLETDRVKLIGQIGEATKAVNAEDAASIQKEHDRQHSLAERLQKEGQATKHKKEAKEEALIELGIMEAHVHHHTRLADSLSHELRLRQEIKRLQEAGIQDENEQRRLAREKIDLEDKQNGQSGGKIRGYDWHNDPKNSANEGKGIDWLHRNGPGGGGENFFKDRFNDSPLDAWRKRQQGDFFKDHGIGERPAPDKHEKAKPADHGNVAQEILHAVRALVSEFKHL